MRFLVLLDHFSTLGISALPGGALAVILMTWHVQDRWPSKAASWRNSRLIVLLWGPGLSGVLSLVYADTPLRVKLVSLSPGQLPAPHALLHFGW